MTRLAAIAAYAVAAFLVGYATDRIARALALRAADDKPQAGSLDTGTETRDPSAWQQRWQQLLDELDLSESDRDAFPRWDATVTYGTGGN